LDYECLGEICRELEALYGIELIETLDLWRQPWTAVVDAEHAAWAAIR